MSDLKNKVIGHVPVASGNLMLIDPCMLRDSLFVGNDSVENWYEESICEELDNFEDESLPIKDRNNSDIGRVFASGLGDGLYPIEATYLPDGTISEIRIIFQL